MADWPLITIVTPSYNQGQFLEQTIQSVIGQNYPALEYFIQDGGSTDESVTVIKKYEKQLAGWISEKDGGQASAINAGFVQSKGQILAWLNSDDYYLPGIFSPVAALLDPRKAQILVGDGLTVDEAQHKASVSFITKRRQTADLRFLDYIIQPSTFWTRAAWEKVGPLNSNLHFTLDWDWYLRAEKAGVEFIYTEKIFSYYRVHTGHKTGSGGDKRAKEIAQIYGQYANPNAQQLFEQLSANHKKKCSWRRLLKRCGCRSKEVALLRWRYGKLTRSLSDQNIQNILAAL